MRPFMSHGCFRCATYGSLEQRQAKAEQLASLIDVAYQSSPSPAHFGCCISSPHSGPCTPTVSPSPASERLAAEKRGIYVASRAGLSERGAMWRRLRSEGVPITSSWIDEDGAGESQSLADLWLRISTEISNSGALVLYAEQGDFPLKGAYIEAGIALGQGKRIVVCLPDVVLDSTSLRPIGSWVTHPLVQRCDDIDEAVKIALGCAALTTPGVGHMLSGYTLQQSLDAYVDLCETRLRDTSLDQKVRDLWLSRQSVACHIRSIADSLVAPVPVGSDDGLVGEPELKTIESDWDYYCHESVRQSLCMTIRRLRATVPVGGAAEDETLLAKAWDTAFDHTIVPRSSWPEDPELRPEGFKQQDSYFRLFMKALRTATTAREGENES